MGVTDVTAVGAMVAMVAMVVTAGGAMVAMAVTVVTLAAGGAMAAGVILYPHQDVMANDVTVKVEKAVTVLRLTISRTALPEYRAQTLAGNRDVR